jgi:presequence protease
MAIKYGFKLIRSEAVPELNADVRLFRHVKTGAELLSVENTDENKVFGITFRTPPGDSTGVPHIMEHAVLSGSRKYPVKEPFVELMKGSLNTFLNAMTFSDKTSYPVASQNLQDFYNLIDVYLDAVFYPRITEETMRQEGWHYELFDPADPLIYKGVVFNEMKGAYSSPDSLISRYSEQSLFPDNAYRFDSGGDPTVIPELTYAQFKGFHKRYYHPSNARIFFYGDDDREERLRIVDAYLRDFDAQPPDSEIALQSKLDRPHTFRYPYPTGEDAEAQKALITVNWLLPENKDPGQTLALLMLSHMLVDTPASPLRKALIDSGIGEEVIDKGIDDSLRQLVFTTGLKGVKAENVEEVEPLILETLTSLVEEGFDRNTIDAAVNTVEFRLREQNYGRYPRGLVVMLQSLSQWLHDGDPIEAVAFENALEAIKARRSQDDRYFETLLETHLVENTHRTVVILEPDPALRQRREAEVREHLEALKSSMDSDALQEVIERARRLQRLQNTPDMPEALATIPSLNLEDLDPHPKATPTEDARLADTRLLTHDLFTNSIAYLDVGFNLRTLPQELLPYAGVFGDLLLEMGTKEQDFVALTQRIGRSTGGIKASHFTSTDRASGRAVAWLFLRGKATVAQTPAMLEILQDILQDVRLDDRRRLMQILLEKKAGEEAQVVPMGHRVVASRLRSKFSEGHWVSEQVNGASYLLFLRRLIKQVEEDWDAVVEALETVRATLINRQAMLCNLTVDGESRSQIEPHLASFLDALPSGPAAEATWHPPFSMQPEGLMIPADVNYVGKGGNLLQVGYERNGATEVIAHYLRSTWLWEKVRVQGGAYGGFCIFDPHSGAFGFLSYRDPNLVRTLETYDRTAAFLRRLDLSEEERVKGIIGAIGTMDAYQLPDAKGYSAMARTLIGYTDEARQQYRTEVLETDSADFHAFADVLEALQDEAAVVVLGSQESIEAANADHDLGIEITPIM